MQQVIVRKQGRYDYSHWSSRVLTLVPVTGMLQLSKKGSPNQIDYHAMQPTRIEVWPHYDRKYVEEDFDSLSAKLTIRLVGSAFPNTAAASSRRVSRMVNSAGVGCDEAWVLRFTSLGALEEALLALEKLTQLHSCETSDGSFGDATKAEPCAQLPMSAKELFDPIRRAWLQEQWKKQDKNDAVGAL
ncbi:hypothetical protein ABB37_09132 [Leptomonas pyrrhocoris]|uniref:Uncharacterized protein n=1 Tax=Leptomonas pyrrhocoris TaxID=157538 RepID=A0A0M9FRL3_LEPPY|nr:hypothetical protein ABB37_09132 [Leptomonas pyrrhocoris]KPA74446.1 hypothetical protein ABB37_09132 [Leptomonas pyrrhocoris]|eukprot:XP_015652885.1 hypothetical protein ABB37_09132 [Leptomonas pyrrhocoris]